MKPRTWEVAWNEGKSRDLWSAPDDGVMALLETLRAEGVRKVLDLGFGLGRHVVLFAREGFEAHGVEPNTSGFTFCRDWLKGEELQADIRRKEMAELPYSDGYFDFVLSWNVIYHGTLRQLKRALEEIRRVTRRSGLVYLTLNSTRNKHCGLGREIEPGTFMNPEKADGDLLHHYSDREEAESLF